MVAHSGCSEGARPLLLTALHEAQPCRYCFYSVVQIGFFAPQARLVDPEIDRVDRLTMESSRVDWPVKSRV